MARRGSFGTSTNPFGKGQFGGMAQYDIGGATSSGENAADLARYQAQVAWSNGTISDEAYLAALLAAQGNVEAGTSAAITAQNRIDDLLYQSGRSQAEAQGLDALIAFDQQSLGGLSSDNVRYRNILDSLNSELARRRSRDYGVLVDAYNAGQGGSTESLLDYVRGVLGSIAPDAPDYDQWVGVVRDLTTRIAAEKDSQVYQDYQDRKIKPADFLAYVQGRRDAFDPESPDWDEWNRRLADATKNVKDTAQAALDTEVFNKYNNHTISDNTYLRYLQKRVDAMAPDDPDRPKWQQELTKMTFSLAEDLLDYEVRRGTKDVKVLISFYKDYASTLNHGSAEYRQIQLKIMSLEKRGGGGGGAYSDLPPATLKELDAIRARAIAAGKSPTKAGILATYHKNQATKARKEKKVIGVGDLFTYANLLMPDVKARSKVRSAQESALVTNFNSLTDALDEQAKVWLFRDPAKPGETVAERNPDGTLHKDKNGKQTYVLGSRYFTATNQALVDLNVIKANHYTDLAVESLANGKEKQYWTNITKSDAAIDAALHARSKATVIEVERQMKGLDKGLEFFNSVGDAAGVVNVLYAKLGLIQAVLDAGGLDETRREKLNDWAREVEGNPLLPVFLEDENGRRIGGQIGGWFDATSPMTARDAKGDRLFVSGAGVYPPDVHFVLDGGADHDTPDFVRASGADADPARWALSHVTVKTSVRGFVYPGEVSMHAIQTVMTIYVRLADGERRIKVPVSAQMITYFDGNGRKVVAYSLDLGKTWLVGDGIREPWLQTTSTNLVSTTHRGKEEIKDKDTGEVLFSFENGEWTQDPKAMAESGVGWYQPSWGRGKYTGEKPDLGGPGYKFDLFGRNPDGSVDILPRVAPQHATPTPGSAAWLKSMQAGPTPGSEAWVKSMKTTPVAGTPEWDRAMRSFGTPTPGSSEWVRAMKTAPYISPATGFTIPVGAAQPTWVSTSPVTAGPTPGSAAWVQSMQSPVLVAPGGGLPPVAPLPTLTVKAPAAALIPKSVAATFSPPTPKTTTPTKTTTTNAAALIPKSVSATFSPPTPQAPVATKNTLPTPTKKVAY